MNEKAQYLGATESRFVNPHGLPDNIAVRILVVLAIGKRSASLRLCKILREETSTTHSALDDF